MRVVKYGVIRDYVRGFEVVLLNGEIINVGGKVVKNSFGYSIKDLLVGLEGILGIVIKVILKLFFLLKKSISLFILFLDLLMVIEIVFKIIKLKLILMVIEFMERDVILVVEEFLGKKFLDNILDVYFLFIFDGNSIEDIEKEYEKVVNLCLENGVLDVFILDI